MMLRRYETGSELRLGRERETWRSSAKILDGMKERKKKKGRRYLWVAEDKPAHHCCCF